MTAIQNRLSVEDQIFAALAEMQQQIDAQAARLQELDEILAGFVGEREQWRAELQARHQHTANVAMTIGEECMQALHGPMAKVFDKAAGKPRKRK